MMTFGHTPVEEGVRVRYHCDSDFFYDGDEARLLNFKRQAIGVTTATDDLLQQQQQQEQQQQQQLQQLQRHAAIRCPNKNCNHDTFLTVDDLNDHIDSVHSHRCSACIRSFPSERLLSLHIDEVHSTYFEVTSMRHPSYVCLVDGCDKLCATDAKRYQHLIIDHLFPPQIILHHPSSNMYKAHIAKVKRGLKNSVTSQQKQQQQESVSDDTENTCVMEVSSNCNEYGKSNNRSIRGSKHDSSKSSTVCTFYALNNCKYGNKCRYQHNPIDSSSIKGSSILIDSTGSSNTMDTHSMITPAADNDGTNKMVEMLSNISFLPRHIAFGRRGRR